MCGKQKLYQICTHIDQIQQSIHQSINILEVLFFGEINCYLSDVASCGEHERRILRAAFSISSIQPSLSVVGWLVSFSFLVSPQCSHRSTCFLCNPLLLNQKQNFGLQYPFISLHLTIITIINIARACRKPKLNLSWLKRYFENIPQCG